MKNKQQIQEAINQPVLSDKEKIILASHYGLKYKEHTKEEIAKVFGVSRERIRQVVVRALKKINL
jgi:DNA-directed RNA polymerase sigma subunit (sigma70/sigma32)